MGGGGCKLIRLHSVSAQDDTVDTGGLSPRLGLRFLMGNGSDRLDRSSR